jgi:hypothetical protein
MSLLRPLRDSVLLLLLLLLLVVVVMVAPLSSLLLCELLLPLLQVSARQAAGGC